MNKIINFFIRRKDKNEERETRNALKIITRYGFDEKNVDNLKYFSFLMFKPDAVASGKVKDLLNELESRSIYPVLIKKTKPTIGKLDDLYKLIRKRYPKIYDIILKQLSGDEVIPVVLVGEKRPFPLLTERLRDLIGPTTVILGKSRHLRYKYGGSGRGFNLTHGTDDPGLAVREALVWFHPREVVRALFLIEKYLKTGEVEMIHKKEYGKIKNLSKKVSFEISEEYACFRMMKEILDELRRMYNSKEEKHLLADITEIWKKEKKIFERFRDLRSRRIRLNALHRKQYPSIKKYRSIQNEKIYILLLQQVGKVKRAIISPIKKKLELSDFLLSLVDEEKYASEDTLMQLVNLADHDIFVDVWDEILLLARGIGLDKVREDIRKKLGVKYL